MARPLTWTAVVFLAGCGSGRASLGSGGTVDGIAATCTQEGCTLQLSISLEELEERAGSDDLSLVDFQLTTMELAREDGQPAPTINDAHPEALDYTATGLDLHVPILIDQSGSMLLTDPEDERLSGAAAIVEDMLGSGGSDNQIAILGFPRTENAIGGELGSLEDTDIWHPFSNNPEELLPALERMADSEGNYTPIYDSIIETAHYLDTELDSDGATRAMVIMTDGADSESSARVSDVLDEVEEAQIPLYVVGLDRPEGSSTTVDYSEIRAMAISSGGLFISSDIKSLRESIADISRVLYSDVILTIYLGFTDGSPPLEPQSWYRVTGRIRYLDDLIIPLDETFYLDQIAE